MVASQSEPETTPTSSADSRIFSQQFSDYSKIDSEQTPPAAPDQPAENPLPSAFSLFAPSSQLVRKNPVSFGGLIFAPVAYLAGVDMLLNSKNIHHHLALWLGLFGVFIVYSFVSFAAKPLLELRAAQGQRLEFLQAVKASFHYYWRLLGLYIVVSLLIVVGLVLLILPGVIMYRRYALAAYFLVDHDVGIREAMEQSAATTKGHGMAIWGIAAVQALLSVSGWVPLIGFLISASFGTLYACAGALRYEQFKALRAITSK